MRPWGSDLSDRLRVTKMTVKSMPTSFDARWQSITFSSLAMSEIMDNPVEGETPQARLKQLGMLSLLYTLHLANIPLDSDKHHGKDRIDAGRSGRADRPAGCPRPFEGRLGEERARTGQGPRIRDIGYALCKTETGQLALGANRLLVIIAGSLHWVEAEAAASLA